MAIAAFVFDDASEVEAVRWRNPDGSLGGFVAPSAKIHPSVVIDRRAMVGPWGTVPAGIQIGPLTYVGMTPP